VSHFFWALLGGKRAYGIMFGSDQREWETGCAFANLERTLAFPSWSRSESNSVGLSVPVVALRIGV